MRISIKCARRIFNKYQQFEPFLQHCTSLKQYSSTLSHNPSHSLPILLFNGPEFFICCCLGHVHQQYLQLKSLFSCIQTPHKLSFSLFTQNHQNFIRTIPSVDRCLGQLDGCFLVKGQTFNNFLRLNRKTYTNETNSIWSHFYSSITAIFFRFLN